MQNLFLTGEPGIGKSTIVEKLMLLFPSGGFRTSFDTGRARPHGRLCIYPAAGPPVFDIVNTVADFSSCPPLPFPGVFDSLGCRYISEAQDDPSVKLLIMDECGSLENRAEAFKQKILSSLDTGKPVLGVLKLSSLSGWTSLIAGHKNTALLTVTVENRGEIFDRALEILSCNKSLRRL